MFDTIPAIMLCFIKRCYDKEEFDTLIVLRDILICSVILVCDREDWDYCIACVVSVQD